MAVRSLPWFSLLACLMLAASAQAGGNNSTSAAVDAELASIRDALLSAGLAEEQAPAAVARIRAARQHRKAGPAEVVAAAATAAATTAGTPAADNNSTSTTDGTPADNNNSTTSSDDMPASGYNSTPPSDGGNSTTTSRPPSRSTRNSTAAPAWSATSGGAVNNSINSRAGVSYVLLTEAMAAGRCVAACPEGIGGGPRWQVLAAANGPLGATPSKRLKLDGLNVLTVHGVCRFYERGSDGIIRSYFGNEVVVADPAGAAARGGAVNTSKCMFTNDAGETCSSSAQATQAGTNPPQGGYLCTCQNTCNIADPAEASCEQKSYWGGKSCPSGCNPCRCRIKRFGVFFVGYFQNGRCFTPGGIARAFDFSVLKCH